MAVKCACRLRIMFSSHRKAAVSSSRMTMAHTMCFRLCSSAASRSISRLRIRKREIECSHENDVSERRYFSLRHPSAAADPPAKKSPRNATRFPRMPAPQAILTGNGDQRRALVVVFLRGAADGLSLVAPVEDDAYFAARP